MKILVTAFEAFGGDDINPTREVLNLLPDEISCLSEEDDCNFNLNRHGQNNNVKIIKRVLPVSYDRSANQLVGLLTELEPDFVLCLGFAASRDAVTPEAAALNVKSSSRPDNDGVIENGTPVILRGENAYFTSLDVKALCERISSIGIPCRVSYHAGTYVCNSTYYTLLAHHPRACFIHLPNDELSVKCRAENTPYLLRRDMLNAVMEAIRFIAENN